MSFQWWPRGLFNLYFFPRVPFWRNFWTHWLIQSRFNREVEIWKIRDSCFTEISGWLVLGQRFNYFEAVAQQSSLSHPISLGKRFYNLFYWIQIYSRFAVLKLNWLINEKTYLHKQDFTTASTLIAMTKRIASWPTKEVNFLYFYAVF